MIGLSARTDEAGAEALSKLLHALGYKARIFETPKGVLHFKSDCSLIDRETILTTHRLAASGVFAGLNPLFVPEGEEAAANALRVNDHLLVGAEYPQTISMLRDEGFQVTPLATREISKVDAGLSCMSLRW